MATRLMVFVDGANLYKNLREVYGDGKYNLLCLAEAVRDGRKLVDIGFYIGLVRQEGNESIYAGQQRFLAHLSKIPLVTVWTGRIQSNYNKKTGEVKYKEKGVDVQLGTNLTAKYVDLYDVAVLISSDGDYVPAVKEAQQRGKIIENASPWTRKSWHLYQVCDGFWDLRRISWDKIEAKRLK